MALNSVVGIETDDRQTDRINRQRATKRTERYREKTERQQIGFILIPGVVERLIIS